MLESAEFAIGSPLQRTQALIAGGRIDAAMHYARVLTRRRPTDRRAWQLLSTALSRAGQWEEAIKCVHRALSLSPNDPASLLQYGQCLMATGRRGEALDVAQRLMSVQSNRADWSDALGTLLTYCEDPGRALPYFKRAVELAPDSSVYLYNLAAAQRMTGDTVAAEANLGRVIGLDPAYVPAYYMRSELRSQTPDANHADEMIRLLAKVRRPQDEIMLCFAIAKELADVSHYGDSFVYLKRGCDLHRRSISYRVADDIATIDRIIQLHDRVAVAAAGAVDTQGHECIFVFGLPRSGTTLVERIIASHTAVRAAGELQAFPIESVRAVQRIVGRSMGKLEFVEQALKVIPRELGQAYLDATRLYRNRASQFIDKQPLNYLYAGLIQRALPRARMIALAREPMDCCYAMYKTLFTGAYPFSYNLIEAGEYYAAWHRLMRHWRSTLGENLLIVQYEDLVSNQEAISRRIMAHCGLPWEDACLSFHEHGNPVTTASAVQVRRPMYSSSVGGWRHFERELESLGEVLKRHQPSSGWRLLAP